MMMKPNPTLAAALAAALASATSASATVLLTGETWSALEEYTFETDSSGDGLSDMSNTGSNGSVFDVNSQSGKFIANGSGQAVTSGNAGTWGRYLPGDGTGPGSGTDAYASPYTTGKFRLEWTLESYDFDNHTGIEGVGNGSNDFDTIAITLRLGGSDVAGLMLRIGDTDDDGQADGVQVRHLGVNGNKFSGFENVVSTLSSNPWTSFAVEFDFDNDTIFYERNGNLFAGTGVSGNDLGAFAGTGFDQIEISAEGVWLGDANDFLNTESFALYTAVPEPSIAFLGGLGVLGLLRRRR